MSHHDNRALGVIPAGGRNSRFGGHKAFADVGGIAIVRRVENALRSVTDHIVIIANDSAYHSLGLPVRKDVRTEGGALTGLLTALQWAQELGRDGILVIACDMPFPSVELLRHIDEVGRDSGADVVLPGSNGPRGVEPLFGAYSTTCIPAIEDALDRGDQRMIAFHAAVRVLTIPRDTVLKYGDPDVLFMNVNTMDELDRANEVAAQNASGR